MALERQKSVVHRHKSANGPDLEVAISRRAQRQRRLVTSAELQALGLSRSGIRHRVNSRRLFRVHAGLFSLSPPPYGSQQRWLAAVLACGTGSLLSDWPGAHLLGLIEGAPRIAEISNATGSGRERAGIIVHRRSIDPRDVSRCHGIPCTSAARTIIDCAERAGAWGPRS